MAALAARAVEQAPADCCGYRPIITSWAAGCLHAEVPFAPLARLGDFASGWLPAELSQARNKSAH